MLVREGLWKSGGWRLDSGAGEDMGGFPTFKRGPVREREIQDELEISSVVGCLRFLQGVSKIECGINGVQQREP